MKELMCNYCGKKTRVSELHIFLNYLLGKEYYVQCPYCLSISSYRIRLWLVHDTMNTKEKDFTITRNKSKRVKIKAKRLPRYLPL